MGYRLSKIYTRTGDQGETGLADGRRVTKDHPRVEAMGEVDSLNSQLGLLLADLMEQAAAGTAAGGPDGRGGQPTLPDRGVRCAEPVPAPAV